MEMFKEIQNYEKLYQITSFGRVFSLRNKSFLVLSNDTKGYQRVQLFNHGKKNYKVHRLVAEAFIPNPENKPQVNHIDGNKQNNHVENLEWCTNQENQRHAWSVGLQKRKELIKYCVYCGKKLERKRFNGRLEDFGVFKKRNHCNLECLRNDKYKK